MRRWRWRGGTALLGVSLALILFPILPVDDVINSDWPAFATGARLLLTNPADLYDFDAQRAAQLQVTGGRSLVGLSIHGILPFLAPAWVALIAVPFDLLGPNLGGRLWILTQLACLLAGLYLAVRPQVTSILHAFAGVPTALLMLNAQLDGMVALGIGGAIALWSRPYLAGLALGLTLVKPQLVLPLGLAAVLTARWRLLAGWATVGSGLTLATLALNPHWIQDWLPTLHTTVVPGSREVDLAHFGTALPEAIYPYAVGALSAVASIVTLGLASRRRTDLQPALAILVVGGVLVSPHALPSDLVLVAFGLAIWGKATGIEWLVLSAIALVAALSPAPAPALLGVVLMLGLSARISFVRPAPALGSAR